MLFTPEEEARIVAHIALAEKLSSGEIRLFVEDFCFRDHPVVRAAEAFALFGMHHTEERNAVLIYIAEKSHHFAIWGDEAIHSKVGSDFWQEEKTVLGNALREGRAAAGICTVIRQIGAKLTHHFPAKPGKEDKNELPNEIIYG
jgi:uncharacterized membrane protein